MMARRDWAKWRWRLGQGQQMKGQRERKKVQNVGKKDPEEENKGCMRSRNGLPSEMAGRKKRGLSDLPGDDGVGRDQYGGGSQGQDGQAPPLRCLPTPWNPVLTCPISSGATNSILSRRAPSLVRDSGGVPAAGPPASTSTLKEGRGVAALDVPGLSPALGSGGRCWGGEADRGGVSTLALPGTASWPSPPVKERA